MKDTLFERIGDGIISLYSAKRVFRRKHWRRMDRDDTYRDSMFTLMRARGYRDAQQNKHGASWLGGSRSADDEIKNDISALINRSREINRDDSIGSGITHTFVTNVIGSGMRPQARTESPEKNQRMETVFKERKRDLFRADAATYNKGQAILYRKTKEDGNVWLHRAKASASDPVWFEIIEYDRLGTPIGAKLTAGHKIIGGVEKDANGVPVAYWFKKAGAVGVSQDSFNRVDASEVRHIKGGQDRPGQTLGVPMFHAVLQDLRDLDLLLVASLKRTQVGAMLAAFITSDSDIDDMMSVTSEKYGWEMDETIEPGMIFKMYPGETLSTLVPNFPVPELVPFIITIARKIGVAVGMCWQLVLRDFGMSNFSSARTDLLESRQTFATDQQAFIEDPLEWIWMTVLEDARLRGDARMRGVTQEDIAAVHHIPPGWQWVDPKKDADATDTKLRLRITTRRDECAAQGKDWEEVQDQLLLEEKTEMEKRKKLKLPEAPAPTSDSSDDVLDEEEIVENYLRQKVGGNGDGLTAKRMGV